MKVLLVSRLRAGLFGAVLLAACSANLAMAETVWLKDARGHDGASEQSTGPVSVKVLDDRIEAVVAMPMLRMSPSAMASDDAALSQFEFNTVDGGVASLSDYRGQVVILNLWAVWCSPCLIEIPHLVALQHELDAADATVIGLAIDSGSASAIARFWQRRLDMEPNFPLWMGTAEQARERFNARIFPTTVIIDRKGQLRQTLVGLQTREDFRRALALLN